MGVRDTQKQATRGRVLAAARDLFDAAGFEATTTRQIADRAGVAVGSVFTTVASKAEILSQVMVDRLEALYAELERVAPHLRGPTVDRLRSLMAIHYSFEMRRARLFVAYIAASYGWPLDGAVTPLGQNKRLQEMLGEQLRRGIEAGDVRPDADVPLFIEALLAAYFWNYRRVVQEGADAAALTAIMDRQLGLLFEGVAARP